MAAESLLGGSAGPLTPDTIVLLDKFILDAIDSSTVTTQLSDNTVLATNTGVVSATAADVKTFFQARIDDELPLSGSDPAVDALNASLTKAVNNLTDNSGDSFSGLSGDLGFHGPGSITTGTSLDQTIVFEATPEPFNDIFAIRLNEVNDFNPEVAIELNGIENAILVGPGTVSVGDNTNVHLEGDNRDQHVTGGGGNDTLVGGGGNDTLIGGSGNDVIGFNAVGNYTIEIDGADKLAFQFDGINSLNDLLPFVTGVSEANGNVTYEFVDGAATITLVGMTADEVTADMVIFNL